MTMLVPIKQKIVKDYVEEQELQVLPHPPYSPDLAPCDFWLFPTPKERLAGKKIYRVIDLAKAVFSNMRSIPKEDHCCGYRKIDNTATDMHKEARIIF